MQPQVQIDPSLIEGLVGEQSQMLLHYREKVIPRWREMASANFICECETADLQA